MTIGLGDKVRDSISGFEGVVVAKHEYLNGCVRVSIQPQALHEGKPVEDFAFDVEQIEVLETAAPRTTEPSGGPRKTPARKAVPRR